MEIADFQKMEQIRARAAELVEDPKPQNIKPYYRQFCKGPVSTIAIYKPLTAIQSNWSTQMVKESENYQRGVVVGGKEYEVDRIIFATGFEVGTMYEDQAMTPAWTVSI